MAMLMAGLLISCNQKNETDKNEMVAMQDIQLNKSEEPNAPPPIASTAGETFNDTTTLLLNAGQPGQKIDWDKKIIKTANLSSN